MRAVSDALTISGSCTASSGMAAGGRQPTGGGRRGSAPPLVALGARTAETGRRAGGRA